MMERPPNPFKGVASYTEPEYGRLFGRDADFVLMKARIFGGRTTLLFAGAGVGKTSFFAAKVIPELKTRHPVPLQVAYHRDWKGGDPLVSVKQHLGALAGESLLQFFERNPGLWILILDQFEELFQNPDYWTGAADLREEIAAVVNSKLPVRIVFSMREEFLGHLSFFDNKIPDVFGNYYRLKSPEPLLAEDIILGISDAVPVSTEGLRSLVQDLSRVEIVGEARQARYVNRESVFLPYLQIVCRCLWDNEALPKEGGRFEFLAAYPSWNAAAGASPTAAAVILEEYCTTRLERLPRTQQLLAARALDFLVTSHGAKRHYSAADLAASMELRTPHLLEQTLRALAGEGILRTWDRDMQTWYELYHDMYAPILYRWKERFQGRRRQRQRRRVKFALAVVGAGIVAGAGLAWSWLERGQTLARTFDQRAAFFGLQEDQDREVTFRLAALQATPSEDRRRSSALAATHLEQLTSTFRHDSPIAAVAFTADGKLAVTASTGGAEPDPGDPDAAETSVARQASVQAWNTAGGSPAGFPWSVTAPASRIALSNAGDLLATAALHGNSQRGETTIRLWRRPGDPLTASVACWADRMDFNMAGDRLLVFCRVPVGAAWASITDHAAVVIAPKVSYASVEFSADGRVAATGGERGDIRLWDTASGRQIGKTIQQGAERIECFAFSPDGKAFAAGSRDASVVIRSVASGSPLFTRMIHNAPVRRMVFPADGRELVTLSGDRAHGVPAVVTRWDLATGTHTPGVTMLSDETPAWTLLANGKLALQRASAGTLAVWNTLDGQPALTDLTGRTWRSFRVSPDGSKVLAAGTGGAAYLWQMDTAAVAPGLVAAEQIPILAGDGDSAAFLLPDNSVALRSLTSNEILRTFRPSFKIVALGLSPDGGLLATAGAAGVEVWDTKTGNGFGQPIDSAGHRIVDQRLTFTARGSLIAATDAGVLVATPQSNGRPRHVDMKGPPYKISGDGNYALSLGKDSLEVWDLRSGKVVRTLAMPPAWGAIAFSADGARLAYWAQNAGIRIVETGAGRQATIQQPELVEVLAFSPDARFLAASCGDRQLRVWDRRSGKLLDQVQTSGVLAYLGFADTGILAASRYWLHWLRLKNGRLIPQANTLLNGGGAGEYWLDRAGTQARAILTAGRPYYLPQVIAWGPGTEADPSLAGDAAALAERYNQKLSLRLENGEVVPVNEVQSPQ